MSATNSDWLERYMTKPDDCTTSQILRGLIAIVDERLVPVREQLQRLHAAQDALDHERVELERHERALALSRSEMATQMKMLEDE